MYDKNKSSMNHCCKKVWNNGCESEKRSSNCSNKHQNYCGCGSKPECHHEPDVVYYSCKEPNCEKYIEKANYLIDKIECKHESLNENLATALVDQGLVGQDLNSLKAELASIANALGALQSGLSAAQSALNNAIKGIDNKFVPNQNNAIKAINNAIEDEEYINNMLNCLDKAVNEAFECLEDAGCPVLVPRPSKECDCGCKPCHCKKDYGWK